MVIASNQMNLAQIRELVAAGEHDQPLPREIVTKRLILALTRSRCCGDRELLVKSRDGGFVVRDCLNCGTRSDYVHLEEIPDLDCAGCLKSFARPKTIEPRLKDPDYWYHCTGCGREWKIGDIVPHWSEAFEYAGLAAPGDPGFVR
jgi:hypothetical protein